MDNNLMIFHFQSNDNQVRMLGTADNPLFCLPDICKVLGLTPSKVVQRLDKGVLSKHTLQTNGGIQKINFVNEDGFYDVVLESRKPVAKQFRKWVTSEVLPSLRKTGKYEFKQEQVYDGNYHLWHEIRKLGKSVRHELTSAIKIHNIHFNIDDTDEGNIIYAQYTNLVYKLLGVEKGLRDKLNALILTNISNMELIEADEIIACLRHNFTKKQTFAQVTERLISYVQSAMLNQRIQLNFIASPNV